MLAHAQKCASVRACARARVRVRVDTHMHACVPARTRMPDLSALDQTRYAEFMIWIRRNELH